MGALVVLVALQLIFIFLARELRLSYERADALKSHAEELVRPTRRPRQPRDSDLRAVGEPRAACRTDPCRRGGRDDVGWRSRCMTMQCRTCSRRVRTSRASSLRPTSLALAARSTRRSTSFARRSSSFIRPCSSESDSPPRLTRSPSGTHDGPGSRPGSVWSRGGVGPRRPRLHRLPGAAGERRRTFRSVRGQRLGDGAAGRRDGSRWPTTVVASSSSD